LRRIDAEDGGGYDLHDAVSPETKREGSGADLTGLQRISAACGFPEQWGPDSFWGLQSTELE
jgi:hypothetical protein